MSSPEPPRAGPTGSPTTVTMPVAVIWRAAVQHQEAEAILEALLLTPCPTDPDGEECYWCGARLVGPDGSYAGDAISTHASPCPWMDLLFYKAQYHPANTIVQ